MENSPVYNVLVSKKPITIDGNWDKPEWQGVKAVAITKRMGKIPVFTPVAQAKMMYDESGLYVIFRVQDRFVRCVVTEFNGPVYEEPCVEFFFSPEIKSPLKYFNLEINCGGTPLMHYNDHALGLHTDLAPEDLEKIEIAHSLPTVVVDEIKEPVTWTLEYRLPLAIIEKYSVIDPPAPGITWRANFYKIAEKGSNVHFLTWSEVINPIPNFHLPEFFGSIRFQ